MVNQPPSRRLSLARLLRWDARASARIGDELAHGKSARHAWTAIAHSGDGSVWTVVSLLGMIFGTPRARRVVKQIGIGVLLASVGVASAKRILRRPRPRAADLGRFPLWPAHDRYSFPSGHSARMMATATVVSAVNSAAGGVLALWSAVISLSRVALGAHYLLDVAMGLATGMLAGELAQLLLPRRKEPEVESNPQ